MGIGVPTGAPGTDRQRHCPGAMLRVTYAEYFALKRDGHVWSTGKEDIRQSGLSDARTYCNRDVAQLRLELYRNQKQQTVVAVYDAALCPTCAELEKINRMGLAQKQAP